MLGFLSIEKKNVQWSKAEGEAYLTMAAVGIIAGIVVAYAQTPLHWPGHKAVFWLAPVLASRILTRARAGATVGASATITTTLLLGGRLAGGVAMMPLVILGGFLLDLAVIQSHRLHVSVAKVALLLAAATAANLICLIKRLFEPVGSYFSAANLHDLFNSAASYALFGFLAGLLGIAAASGIRLFWKRQ